MTADSARKVYVVVGVSIGLLCVLQAALNISLRLANNKMLDIETDYKNLTEEINKLKKIMILYENYLKQGWVHFDFSGSIYYVSSERKSWQQSRYDCLVKGADLMIINSKEEQTFTRQLKDEMWIGLTDRETEGQWKWVDGTPLNTSYWISGEPNSHGGKEDCVQVRYHNRENNWNDRPCNAQNFWICEKKVAL